MAVARYTPQAVLIANVEEARYDALVEEEGKALVRARYAVRNNQRAFLAVTLPEGATLWSASVAGRPLRPGVSRRRSLLLRSKRAAPGEETPTFAVEVTYVQRGAAWSEKGRAALDPSRPRPAGLPDRRGAPSLAAVQRDTRSRRISSRDGFRAVHAAALTRRILACRIACARRRRPSAAAEVDALVAQFRKDTAGRTVTGPLPVRVPFPEFGPTRVSRCPS